MDSVADTSADRLVIDEDEPMDETPGGIVSEDSTSSIITGAANSAVDAAAASSSAAHNDPSVDALSVVNHDTLLAPPPRVKSEPPGSGEDTHDSVHISATNRAQKSSSSKTTDATRSASDSKSSSKRKRKKSKSSSVEGQDCSGPELASVKSEPGAFAASSAVFDTNGMSTPPPLAPPTTTTAVAQHQQQQPASQQPPTKTKKKKLSMTPATGAGNDADSGAPPSAAKKPKTMEKQIAQEKLERRDASTWVRTVASSTDPEALGPCEPGSHVVLEGVVWNETPTGVLVVNVTWRGKSYVGTLLDCTRHDWAPPRICESPLLDLERTPAKGRNGKRNNRSALCHSASTSDLPVTATSNQNKNSHKKKTSKAGQLTVVIPPPTAGAVAGNSDEDSLSSLPPKPTSVSENILEPLSPVLQPCPCKHCDKRYAEPVALKFHQSAAHPKLPSPVPVMIDSPLVVDSSCSNGPSCNIKTVLTSEELESASLAALFNVVVDKNIASTSRAPGSDDLPKLEPPPQPEVDRSTRTPGAYSDISDDGAPLLEKETAGDKTGQSPKKGAGDKLRSSTPLATTPTAMTNGTAGDGGTPKGGSVSSSSPSSSHLKRSSSSSNKESSATANGHAGGSAQTTTSALSSPCPSTKSITTSVTSNSPTASFIQAVGPAVPGPMMPNGLVMPFGTPTTSFGGPHTSPFQRPPFAVLPAFSHGLFVPQMPPPPSPNLNNGKQVQHKIHELTSAASSPPSTGGKGSTTTATMSSSKGAGDVVMSSSVIPPVQRHLHMHQHTHSFPLFPPPGLDYATNPYAATAAMFGHNGTPINLAYPPK